MPAREVPPRVGVPESRYRLVNTVVAKLRTTLPKLHTNFTQLTSVDREKARAGKEQYAVISFQEIADGGFRVVTLNTDGPDHILRASNDHKYYVVNNAFLRLLEKVLMGSRGSSITVRPGFSVNVLNELIIKYYDDKTTDSDADSLAPIIGKYVLPDNSTQVEYTDGSRVREMLTRHIVSMACSKFKMGDDIDTRVRSCESCLWYYGLDLGFGGSPMMIAALTKECFVTPQVAVAVYDTNVSETRWWAENSTSPFGKLRRGEPVAQELAFDILADKASAAILAQYMGVAERFERDSRCKARFMVVPLQLIFYLFNTDDNVRSTLVYSFDGKLSVVTNDEGRKWTHRPASDNLKKRCEAKHLYNRESSPFGRQNFRDYKEAKDFELKDVDVMEYPVDCRELKIADDGYHANYFFVDHERKAFWLIEMNTTVYHHNVATRIQHVSGYKFMGRHRYAYPLDHPGLCRYIAAYQILHHIRNPKRWNEDSLRRNELKDGEGEIFRDMLVDFFTIMRNRYACDDKAPTSTRAPELPPTTDRPHAFTHWARAVPNKARMRELTCAVYDPRPPAVQDQASEYNAVMLAVVEREYHKSIINSKLLKKRTQNYDEIKDLYAKTIPPDGEFRFKLLNLNMDLKVVLPVLHGLSYYKPEFVDETYRTLLLIARLRRRGTPAEKSLPEVFAGPPQQGDGRMNRLGSDYIGRDLRVAGGPSELRDHICYVHDAQDGHQYKPTHVECVFPYLNKAADPASDPTRTIATVTTDYVRPVVTVTFAARQALIRACTTGGPQSVSLVMDRHLGAYTMPGEFDADTSTECVYTQNLQCTSDDDYKMFGPKCKTWAYDNYACYANKPYVERMDREATKLAELAARININNKRAKVLTDELVKKRKRRRIESNKVRIREIEDILANRKRRRDDQETPIVTRPHRRNKRLKVVRGTALPRAYLRNIKNAQHAGASDTPA